MKCKTCKNEIPDGSIFCNWCGARQVKEQKKKDEIKVPAPQQLPSGKWRIQLRAENVSITENTPELCEAKAKAIRAGWLEKKKNTHTTLRDAITNYINKRDAVLSPSTIRGYVQIRDNRFSDVMDIELRDGMDWQRICNQEAKTCSAKTLKNAWGLVSSVLKDNGLTVPSVRLPQIVKAEKKWLTPDQIHIFIAAAKDDEAAIPAMMALCSLRRSEILAVTWDDIGKNFDTIRVSGAMVEDKDGRFAVKRENKNASSARTIPVLMPELKDALMRMGRGKGRIVTIHPNTINSRVNRICRSVGLPEVGTHGLRHSFASLAHSLGVPEREAMAIGGWSDRATMDKVYTHLSEGNISGAKTRLLSFFTHDITHEQ
jgi:integrase